MEWLSGFLKQVFENKPLPIGIGLVAACMFALDCFGLLGTVDLKIVHSVYLAGGICVATVVVAWVDATSSKYKKSQKKSRDGVSW